MEKVNVVIKAPSGIHARPASALVKAASMYSSSIKLMLGDKEADAKRMLSVLGLGAKQNDTIIITAEGDDEKEAVAAVKEAIENAE